jgi:serine protease inhibitor ecotin
MSKLLSLIVAALFAVASMTAMAQEKKAEKKAEKPKAEKSMKDAPKKEPTAAQKKQQERMKECNAQAADKGLKGDDRKKFMSGCLKPAAKKGEAKAKAEPKKADKK